MTAVYTAKPYFSKIMVSEDVKLNNVLEDICILLLGALVSSEAILLTDWYQWEKGFA
jgi:hypothetical protein